MGLGHCAASAAVGTAGRHRVLRRVAMPATWPSTPMGSSRKPQQAVRSVFSCVASRNRGPSGTRTAPVRVFYWPTGRKIQPRKPRPSRAERHRPRAIARTTPASCGPSAPADTAGLHRFRRKIAMPTTWASATAGSIRITTLTVRAVFRCVASRNRGAAGHSNWAVSTLTKARAVTRTRPPRGRCLPAPLNPAHTKASPPHRKARSAESD